MFKICLILTCLEEILLIVVKHIIMASTKFLLIFHRKLIGPLIAIACLFYHPTRTAYNIIISIWQKIQIKRQNKGVTVQNRRNKSQLLQGSNPTNINCVSYCLVSNKLLKFA